MGLIDDLIKRDQTLSADYNVFKMMLCYEHIQIFSEIRKFSILFA